MFALISVGIAAFVIGCLTPLLESKIAVWFAAVRGRRFNHSAGGVLLAASGVALLLSSVLLIFLSTMHHTRHTGPVLVISCMAGFGIARLVRREL